MEFVYPPVIAACRLLFRLLDMRIDIEGAERIPRSGGAVVACTHVSFLDFVFCGLPGADVGRKTRFMAKHQVFAHPIGGPLMRGMRHIPVDRSAGQASYQHAVSALRAGEVVGVFPEATISQSFTVKDLKSGAVRMAAEAGVPVIPMAVWGTQRLWTKGHRPDLLQRHIPILIRAGEPWQPTPDDDPDKQTALLHERMSALLDSAQRTYPAQATEGQWWQPAHLGGSAPTPEEAAARDRADATDRRH